MWINSPNQDSPTELVGPCGLQRPHSLPPRLPGAHLEIPRLLAAYREIAGQEVDTFMDHKITSNRVDLLGTAGRIVHLGHIGY